MNSAVVAAAVRAAVGEGVAVVWHLQYLLLPSAALHVGPAAVALRVVDMCVRMIVEGGWCRVRLPGRRGGGIVVGR